MNFETETIEQIQEKINRYPRLRHLDCKDPDCGACMDDARGLSNYLYDRMIYNQVDVLSKYRKWLDSNNILSENEYGWILPSAYDPKNIERFLRWWNEE